MDILIAHQKMYTFMKVKYLLNLNYKINTIPNILVQNVINQITAPLRYPIEAYNQEGELIWEREQDLYGDSRQGFAKENFRCPFKYQGQYYDPEIELCYNRFRYYHPETGRYISEDPIKLLGGFNVFAYVSDTNIKLDELGLLGEEFDVGDCIRIYKNRKKTLIYVLIMQDKKQ